MHEPLPIERGIPIPLKFTPYRESKYPFLKIEIGDSFFVPVDETSAHRLTRRMLAKMGRERAGHLGYEFSLRTLLGGVRVWRVR